MSWKGWGWQCGDSEGMEQINKLWGRNQKFGKEIMEKIEKVQLDLRGIIKWVEHAQVLSDIEFRIVVYY